ncbi:hypothetical protein DPMN_187458 [Dreissena polymorpha]|uniref:Uncharacterized protein n=1 Tax=Dreissena polymorpha TaxID=45954 RepID=A0A9D4IAF9_DREPO|nr:hypothetical protein DPMN_187458 [Dreissena polymorpha]
MPSPQTADKPDDGQNDQEKEEPSQPQINSEQTGAISQLFEDNTLLYDLTHNDYE